MTTTYIKIYKLRFFVLHCLFLLALPAFPQQTENWLHLDPQQDHVMGISSSRAYQYLEGRKADTVIVAVLDNGAEISHIDLKNVIWTNKEEIPNNGIDDDRNGYIDDIHGWNFLGNNKGINLKRETTELTRTYARLKAAYEKSGGHLDNNDAVLYQQVSARYNTEVENTSLELEWYRNALKKYKGNDTLLPIKMKKRISDLQADLDTRLNPNCNNRREIVGDNPDNLQDSIYGNNRVDATGPYHGTGVAGIIGAENNNIGCLGVARCVKLMILRIVPNGDERDKDIALAILYAVRNGAAIINCSFAKPYTSHPEFVEKAILEASAKGVLIVHGAGNDANNNDIYPYYPEGRLKGNITADNWITVGASDKYLSDSLIAGFSNYGRNTVDVFAPGVDILTCALNNGFDSGSGTSCSTPVVAGMAAVLKSYFPYLTASELKQIIIRSVTSQGKTRVRIPGSTGHKYVKMRNICVSGGVVNLYRAIRLVEKEYPKSK